MPSQTIKRTMDQRRALIAECKRRREAGESAKDICAALQINIKTFHKWAKIHGFRLSDIDPDHPRARAILPPGPSAETSSGRYMRGEGLGRPRSGGRQKLLTPEEEAHFGANPFLAWLVGERAKAMGDRERCAAIFFAATGQRLTATNFGTLLKAAQTDPAYDWQIYWGAFGHECMAQWDDDELRARVTFRQLYEPARWPGPPEHKRPAQSWIDHFLGADTNVVRETLAPPPPYEPFTGCHAAANMALNPLGLIPSQQE